MRPPWRLLAAAALCCALAPVARAQQLAVGDPLEDYLRVLQLAGRAATAGPAGASFTIRPLARDWAIAGVAAGSTHPWRDRLAAAPRAARLGAARLIAAETELRLFENSAFPSGQNDGAVWQGRGLTAALDAGGTLRWGPLTVEVRPTLVYTQNRAFPLAPVSAPGRTNYANPWHPRVNGQGGWIDAPQRFGTEAFWRLDPGQTSLRVDAAGVLAGFGWENLWWGPGVRNAIVMSNNAPGFPHAFLGTSRPRDVGVGHVEAQWVWGRLQGSGWSDSVVSDTARFITGLVGSFAPKALPGLTLGATRMFYAYLPPAGLGLSDYLLVLQGITKRGFATDSNPDGNDARDQLLSLFARWVLPESGFEAYLEWARNDHSWDLRDFMLEPEHSQSYTLGFQKVIQLSGDRLLRLGGELTHLERSPTFQVRAEPTYYVHHLVREGYTQRGQVIGAGIGPGSNAQRLWGDVFTRWGRVGAFVGRQVHDNDAYYAQVQDYRRNDVSLTIGVTGLLFVRGFDVGGSLAWTKEYNRYFVLRDDRTNLGFHLSVRWHPL